MHPLIYDREQSLWELERELMAEERRQHQLYGTPLPVRGGTSFSGAETLLSMATAPGAVGPIATPGLSILSRECLKPIAPDYFMKLGNRFHIHSHGTISTTATVPTYQLQFVTGPTYANPLATNQVVLANISAFGGTTTITPAAAANMDWYLDILMTVRATGTTGTLLAVGRLLNNWAATATYVITPFKNATPPTAVTVLPSTSGLLASLYFDLNIIMGAATAGNTINCLDYQLLSLN